TGNITILNGTMKIYGDYLHVNFTGAYGNITEDGHGQEWRSVNGNITIGVSGKLDGIGLGFPTGIGPGSGTLGASHGAMTDGILGGSMVIYGNASAPTSLGSGGASAGFGGGSAIKLQGDNILIDGNISMNVNSASYVYMGSGGSIWLKANIISGSGNLSADGGIPPLENPSYWSYGGGGGRIRFEYGSTMNLTGKISVKSGISQGSGGSNVTNAPGTLTFTNNTWPSNFIVKGDIGLLGGDYGEGNVTNIRGNFSVLSDTTLGIYGDCFIDPKNPSSCWNKTANGRGVWINASGDINISLGALVHGDFLGFPNNTGPGLCGGAAGSAHGGNGQSCSNTYGNEKEPINLGSGGASISGNDARGGSAVRLQSDTGNIIIDGVINMMGSGGQYFYGASGGSIWLDGKNILGKGNLSANSLDDATAGWSSGGGGGRIALTSTGTINFTGIIINTGAKQNQIPKGSGGTVFINATTSINSPMNISTVGFNGGNITFIDTKITLSGIYNASNFTGGSTVERIIVNYTDCSSSFVGAKFNPIATYQTNCPLPPLVTIIFPSNNTYSPDNGLDVLYNATDAAGIGSCWYSNDTMLKNMSLGTAGSCVNITNITWTEGRHNVTVWANDTAGNENHSTITFGIDTVKPDINFTFPTPDNASSQTATSVYVNVSTNDENEHSAFIDWNRSLVGWWSFESVNSSGTVFDNSTWGNNGNMTGFNFNTTVTGIRGKALEFDGINDYVKVNYKDAYDFNNSFTIATWFKINPDAFTGTHVLIGRANNYYFLSAGSKGFYLLLRDLYGTDTVIFNAAGASNNVDIQWAGGSDNQWHSAVGVRDGSIFTLYVDGISRGTSTSSIGDMVLVNESLYLGTNRGGAGDNFNGSIDEVMIFSRALTPEEINASYNAGTYKLYNNFTGLSTGQYNFTAYAIDAAGNVNSTEQRSVTITAETIKPNIAIVTPTNNTYSSDTGLDVNYTVSDNVAVGSCWYSNDTMLRNFSLGTAGSCVNITNITWTEGRHNVTVWANDTAGNENHSTITFGIDTIKPNINFTFPTPDNASSQTATSVYVNVSTSDANEHSAFIDWNRSLVGWWSFESVLTNGTVYDNSSYGSHGTLNNHATNTTVTGIRGDALQFDGINDYINASNSNIFNLNDSFTVSVWFKTLPSGSYGVLVGRANTDFYLDTGEKGFYLVVVNNSGDYLTFNIGGSLNSHGLYSTAVHDNQWHHAVGVRNGTIYYLYLDGVWQETESFTIGDMSAPNESLLIGRSRSSGYYFNGSIDEVMIWNRALSLQEINATYQTGTYKLYKNFTELPTGNYNYTAYAIDEAGNTNKTEQRTVTISAVTVVTPGVNTWNCSSTQQAI
ncbi:MAG: LamG domain-containing protein, partial [Candidatus Pacearchaeota archaeon]|nr:LamG domain-containing protein [Candidatus Pacearchaeota archaeon]